MMIINSHIHTHHLPTHIPSQCQRCQSVILRRTLELLAQHLSHSLTTTLLTSLLAIQLMSMLPVYPSICHLTVIQRRHLTLPTPTASLSRRINQNQNLSILEVQGDHTLHLPQVKFQSTMPPNHTNEMI